MTTTNAPSYVSYAPVAPTSGPFAFSFRIFAESEMRVVKRNVSTGVDTVLRSSDFSVSAGPWPAGGTVTTTVAVDGPNETITLKANISSTQNSDLVDGDALPATPTEDTLDRIMMCVKQVEESLTRALLLQESSAIRPALVLDPDSTNKVLVWNGTQFAFEDLATLSPSSVAVSAFMQTVLDDTSAANGLTTLLFSSYVQGLRTAATAAAYRAASGTEFIGPENCCVTYTVAANALTVTIKGVDGSAPSASNPVRIPFRKSTGDFDFVEVTTALTATLAAGTTLGCANNLPFRIWIAAFDKAGGPVLAFIKATDGIPATPAASQNYETAKVFDMAGTGQSASSASPNLALQWYAPSGATGTVAFTVLGYIEYNNGLATAGQWTNGGGAVSAYPGMPRPGQVVGEAVYYEGGVATGTTVIPRDDTIPQDTEGDSYMALSPSFVKAGANLHRVTAELNLNHSTAELSMVAALFVSGTANAIGVGVGGRAGAASGECKVRVEAIVPAVNATYAVRAGTASAGTTTFNGRAGVRQYGGMDRSVLRIEELMT